MDRKGGIYALGIGLLTFAGCSSTLDEYRCTSHEQCVSGGSAGLCHSSGYCTFLDEAGCGGQRFGEYSGELSNQCVDAVPDAGPTAMDAAPVADAAPPTPSLHIAAGANDSCRLIETQLECWGGNTNGELGQGDTMPRNSPIQVSGSWQAIDAGEKSMCGIQSNGSLWCWGDNLLGGLGVGDMMPRLSPTQVGLDRDWLSVSVGRHNTCAVKTDRTLWCWGDNNEGQLGLGNRVDRLEPEQVPGTSWRVFSAGRWNACATQGDGVLSCWGRGSDSAHGLGDSATYEEPQQVVQASWSVIDVTRHHACGIRENGTLWCWGANDLGQVGIGIPGAKETRPLRVGGDADWKTLATGSHHTCAIKEDGSLWTWGKNERGQLGVDDELDRAEPVLVAEGQLFTACSAHLDHTCAIDDAGSFYCWGDNVEGQLGLGDLVRRHVPTLVP